MVVAGRYATSQSDHWHKLERCTSTSATTSTNVCLHELQHCTGGLRHRRAKVPALDSLPHPRTASSGPTTLAAKMHVVRAVTAQQSDCMRDRSTPAATRTTLRADKEPSAQCPIFHASPGGKSSLCLRFVPASLPRGMPLPSTYHCKIAAVLGTPRRLSLHTLQPCKLQYTLSDSSAWPGRMTVTRPQYISSAPGPGPYTLPVASILGPGGAAGGAAGSTTGSTAGASAAIGGNASGASGSASEVVSEEEDAAPTPTSDAVATLASDAAASPFSYMCSCLAFAFVL